MKIRLKRAHFLIVAALFFFVVTAWLGAPPGNIWNSPDETANAFWSDQISERQPLMIRDFVVGIANGVVHPRSMDVYGNALVPGSFPGIFLLYGSLKYFTRIPLFAMTPIATALAGLVLFALFRKLFDERAAFWSAILFFLHPALIYYSSRGLFHNVLFIDLLIFAVAFFTLRPLGRLYGREHWADDIFAGVLFGFALITRASEAPWVLLGALAFLPFTQKRAWSRVLYVVLGTAIPLFIFLNLNASLYGSFFRTGYTVPATIESSASETVAAALDSADLSMSAGSQILPFGFHPRLILLHGLDYGLKIFWWFSAAGLLGVAVFLARWRRHDKKRRVYFMAALGIGVWLLLFYGSWYVRDNYDPTRVTIGTSYVRYFLPIYVMTLPWVAVGLIWIVEKLPKPKKWILPILVGLMLIMSFRVAVTNGDESLLAVRNTLRENLKKRNVLKWAVPPGTVVMTDRFDKVLFPDRKLIIPIADDTAFETIPVIMQYTDVMWYGLDLSDEDYETLRLKAEANGLEITEDGTPVEGETLYKFTLQ